MTEVHEHWLQLAANAWEAGAHDVMHEGRVLTTEEVLDLTIGAVLNDLRRQVDSLLADAYIDWRSAIPGDTAAVGVASARAETLRAILEVIYTGGTDG